MKNWLRIRTTVGILLWLSGAASAQFAPSSGKLLSLARFSKLRAGERSLAGQAAGAAGVNESFGKLPLAFEPNLGQTDARVRFLARGGGMTAFFTDTETVMVLSRPGQAADKLQQAVVRMRLAGVTSPRQAVGLESLPGLSNYFIGNDPAKWHTDVPHYARVQFEGVYPGIDLVWYGNQRQLEYDFVVAPGADPKRIQVAYEGVESVGVAPNGDLVLRTALGEVRQQQPRVYQEIGGKRVEVGARYSLVAHTRVTFELAKFDRNRELRIDPVVLAYSTYLGGSGSDAGRGIAVDAAGAAYIVGSTDSVNFPTGSAFQTVLHGVSNAVVTKLTPAGSALVYSTYLGGSNRDAGYAIAVDGTGSAYVTGYASSNDFPIHSAFQATLHGVSDAFVTKLSPGGNALVYSTYLGGGDQDYGSSIAVDGAGSAYVTGDAQSTDFPTRSAYQAVLPSPESIFLTKLAPAGNALVYSTYLGGSVWDLPGGVAVDAAGSAYLTGTAGSHNFPVKSAYQAMLKGSTNLFVTKMTPAGDALVYSTYLGGSVADDAGGIAVDAAGSAYVTGYTASADFPSQVAYQATLRGYQNAFVTKLSPAGNALVYSTYLGGSGMDQGVGIAVDKAGSVYVSGVTTSTDFPVRAAYQATYGGGFDAFVAKFTPAGDALVYSTYLGGSAQDYSYGIAVDGAGAAYATGYTLSTDFPTQSAYQPTNRGTDDGFVTKLPAYPVAVPILTAPTNGETGLVGAQTLSWRASAGATSYDVYLGTSAPPSLVANTTATSYVPGTLTPGATYYWNIAAKNSNGAVTSATWSFTMQIAPPPAPVLSAPANGATGTDLAPTLTWSAASGATSYDVYFGTAIQPPLTTNTTLTTYSPATLTPGTQYYWCVVAKNAGGSNTSATWSFTTISPPPPPVLTQPANGATGVPLGTILNWSAAPGAASYDVYFGTVASPPLAGNATATSYSAGSLAPNTLYYWRVVAKNAGGSNTSATWSFTTVLGVPTLTSPLNGATDVTTAPVLEWSAAPGATSYDVYFGLSNPPPRVINLFGTSYSPGTLSPGTVYYWLVVAKNSGGLSPSATWSFTTQLAPPALLGPANAAAGVSLTPILSWTATTGAASYDLRFGTSSPPALLTSTTGTNYTPATLAGGTVYYWQVVARSAASSSSSAIWSFTTQVGAPALVAPANGATGVSLAPMLSWNAATGATSYDVYFGTQASPPLVTNTSATSYSPGALSAGTLYFWRVVAKDSSSASGSAQWSFATPMASQPASALQFIPVAPCRIVDTRGDEGPFGGPSMAAGELRAIAIPQSGCGIPPTAQAYSLNVTVVPSARLSYLTLWPAGKAQPGVSTLNSFDGSVVANAAVVPAGAGGAVSVFVTDPTEVILDIDGYFDTAIGGTSYSFYPAAPCRIADTRDAAGMFGGPSMSASEKRDFDIPSSSCGLSAAAKAYSMNVTVVPNTATHFLGYLTTWPAGQPQPGVSTLNSWKGKVVANAAIVPAGTNGAISVFVTDPTDVILDANGYFAAPGGAGALSFYTLAPCRVADTRGGAGPFGGPFMADGTARSFAIPASGCAVPATAAAYSMNVTVVPTGTLSYLTTWPTGSAQPLVSTLNSFDGSVVANAAIVPAGTGGAISVFVTNETHVILDINGYFAP